MKFKNRFIRMAMAFAIVGVVASQIPSRPSVSLAADGYVDRGNGLLTLKGAGGAAAGGVLVGAIYGAIVNAGRSTGGGVIKGAALPGGSSPIYDVTSSKPDEFSEISRIIRNADEVTNYRKNGAYTVFWPTNDALTKALGAERVNALGQAANASQAKTFLAAITVSGSYNLQRLRDAANQGTTLKTLSDGAVVLKIDGGKLTANGVEVLGSEYPATNGWVLATNGIIATDD
jgi:uncharacterized surface protein with fasciclin (FAS1) repeats